MLLLLSALCWSAAAPQAVPWVLLWVWFLDVFLMFVPAMGPLRGPVYGGLLEQVTGICCDHLLMYVFAYLWCQEEKGTELSKAYALGGLAAVMHMLEIVPLGEWQVLHAMLETCAAFWRTVTWQWNIDLSGIVVAGLSCQLPAFLTHQVVHTEVQW